MAKKLDPIVLEMVEKTYAELGLDKSGKLLPFPLRKTPKLESRNWQDPEGYRYLFPWSNGVFLRFLIRKYTESLPKSEFRRKTQLDDAIRSFVRNIEEGFKRSTTKEYLEFLGFSQGSLEEVKGDIRELAEDRFLKSVPGSSLEKLGINLQDFNLALRRPRQRLAGKLREGLEDNLKDKLKENVRGKLEDRLEEQFAYHDITELYPPLKKIKAEDLTYEVFMELINKSDYLLRKLVASLEEKLAKEQKYYQVEQVKLNRKSIGD